MTVKKKDFDGDALKCASKQLLASMVLVYKDVSACALTPIKFRSIVVETREKAHEGTVVFIDTDPVKIVMVLD